MRILGMFLFVIFNALITTNLPAATNSLSWSLKFLIVDESAHPIRGAEVNIAYLDTSKPGAVTLTNWYSHMSLTNVITDVNGFCAVSGEGTPDGWQCHFLMRGYATKFRMYNGPANFTGMNGPGPAHQSHTEMLIRSNASPTIYPEWKMTIKAVDSLGHPVAAALAKIYFHSDHVADGLTDSNGLFAFSTNLASWDIRLDAGKAGFYDATEGVHLGDRENYSPEKWNQMVTLQLDKIDSVPMYAKREEIKIQREDAPIGFDLVAGDWVAPIGIGTNADFYFTLKRKILNARDYDCELRLTFPNKGDGVIAIPPGLPTGSPLLLPHAAPANGYRPERIWHFSKTNKQEAVAGYFFRVHTLMNEAGKIVGAQYGKIQGEIRFYAGTKAPKAGMGFNYYLNPTLNSLNVEFDPKHNLANHLDDLEAVHQP
ncbi:MAG: hypothetical protein P4L50_20315 [Anaerolineaceae bacterium]|nr:hypothetical protein [Anaerolineaceae bacterium]